MKVPQVASIRRFHRWPLYEGSTGGPYTKVPQVSPFKGSTGGLYMKVPQVVFIQRFYRWSLYRGSIGGLYAEAPQVAYVQMFH